MAELRQAAFVGGELAPSLHGRTDLEKYNMGLKTCRNFIIQAHGGATNRPGTDFIGEIKDSSARGRLIPFSFSTTQVYSLEFGNLTMRVIKDGGHVLEPEVTIIGVTQANPAVVTATAHGYSNGEEVYIDDVVGMTELNGFRFIVANKTANTFELTGIDSTAYTAYTSGGTVARIFTLGTPYTTADLPTLKFTQSADVMTLSHIDYAQRELTRTDHYVWTLSTISYEPTIDPPTSVTVTPQGTSGSTTYNYKVTAVAEETLEESLTAAGSTGTGHASMDDTNFNRITWTAPSGDIEKYNVYKEENGTYGYIGSVDGTATLQFDDTNYSPDLGDTPPKARNPFANNNHPGVSTYYEQRHVSAGSDDNPQTTDMSQTGNFKNMNKSTPGKDDDAISFTLNSRQVNKIRHLIPLEDLIMFTSGGEWKIGSGADAFTLSNMRVRMQSEYGSSEVPPVVIGNTILFVQAMGAAIRDYGYTFETDNYTGNDLSILANHLFQGYQIEEMTFAQIPFSVLWCIREDGELLGLTYIKEHQVWGWHHHDTDGEFESVCVIDGTTEQEVYFIVKRTINGATKRFVEKMHTRHITEVEDAFFVDCGLTYNVPVTISGATQAEPVVITATAHGFVNGEEVRITHVDGTYDEEGTHLTGMTELNQGYFKVANKTANTFELTRTDDDVDIDGTAYKAYISGGEVRKTVSSVSGLDHLEGKVVAVFADGNVHPELTVSSGAITLQRAASEIHVGLPFTSDLETLNISQFPGQISVQGKKKKVASVDILFEKSRGGWVGSKKDDLVELKQREDEPYGTPIALITDTKKLTLTQSWNKGGQVLIRQIDPLPMTILSISPNVVIGD